MKVYFILVVLFHCLQIYSADSESPILNDTDSESPILNDTTNKSIIISEKEIISRIKVYRDACYSFLVRIYTTLQSSSQDNNLVSMYDVDKERLMLDNLYYMKWANTLLSKSYEDEIVKQYYKYEYSKASDYERMHNSSIYAYVMLKEIIAEKWEARESLDAGEEAYFRSSGIRLHNNTEYVELEKNIAKIENEIPCLLEKMKSITEVAARATNEYVGNQDASNKDELRQKFRDTSMSLSLVTYTIADKIEEIETLRFRLLGFLPSYERTQKVLNAMKRFVVL
uniref:Uncharacterized protein n=1 Tax=Schistosoma mansoni TaxID=6183 RepID=A0A5K4FGZ1_SCHMA